MSVEKLSKLLKKEPVPFTQVHTKVIQSITDIEAGFIWIYLLSMPEDWIVVKQQIRNHFDMGKNKINSIFSYLKQTNLIDYVIERDEVGKIIRYEVHVLNGSRFTPLASGMEIMSQANHVTCKTAPTKEEVITKKEKRKKDISCSTSVEPKKVVVDNLKEAEALPKEEAKKAPGRDYFADFWKAYPRKQNRAKARQVWDKLKCDDKFEMIYMDVIKRRAADQQWRNITYIPHATTYLTGERWNDEIVKIQTNGEVANGKATNAEKHWGYCEAILREQAGNDSATQAITNDFVDNNPIYEVSGHLGKQME